MLRIGCRPVGNGNISKNQGGFWLFYNSFLYKYTVDEDCGMFDFYLQYMGNGSQTFHAIKSLRAVFVKQQCVCQSCFLACLCTVHYARDCRMDKYLYDNYFRKYIFCFWVFMTYPGFVVISFRPSLPIPI